MIELDAKDSGWILVTKYWKPTCYKGEHYQWVKGTEEEVLVDCDTLVSYYLFITRGIASTNDDQQYVKLYNINRFLLNVAKKVLDKDIFVSILKHFNFGKPSLSPSQALFYELHAALQNLQVQDTTKDNEIVELVKFDYSNVFNHKDEGIRDES